MGAPIDGRQSGFSMIEVLITIFLIAVAMLGSAQLQAYSMKVNQASQFRGQAVVLAMDLLERIEANNAGALANGYVAVLPTSAAAPDCAGVPCTPAQMAASDLGQFQTLIQKQLPESGATITAAAAGGGAITYTVQVSWRERLFKARGSNVAGNANTEPFSYTVSRTVYDRAKAL